MKQYFWESWDKQFIAGRLVGPIERDTHSVQDIFRFVLTFAKRRREALRPLSDMATKQIDMWTRALVAWLSKLADKAVLALYLNNARAANHAPPALSFARPGKRK